MYFETVNTLINDNDDTIWNDFRDLDWSESIDIVAEEVWCGFIITNETKQEAIELIKEGSKLAAVKMVKFSTKDPDNDEAPCLGLKDAKDYVDMLQDKLRSEGIIK